MTRFSSTCAGIMFAAALMMGGCQNKQSTASSSATDSVRMGAINDRCPISGMAVSPDAKTSRYNNQTIGFCCPKCQAKWDAMSTAEKDKFVAACQASKQGK